MGFEIEIHKDYFVHDEDDDKWIPVVSARNWVILSGDKRLSMQAINIEAIRSSRAQVLLVTDTNSLPEQWAASIIVGRSRIQELLDRNPGPVFIKIGKQAKDHVEVGRNRVFRQETAETSPEPTMIEGIADSVNGLPVDQEKPAPEKATEATQALGGLPPA